jgi:polysaccharide export outer membrane protein
MNLPRRGSMVNIKSMMKSMICQALFVIILLSGGIPLRASEVALHSGDILNVRLAGVPAEDISQVSGFYTIDGSGDINIPYIGKIHAAGLKQAEVQNSIETTFKTKDIYSSPIVSVSVQFDRFVDVEGDVRSPQRVKYTSDLTVLGAITACGGFTDYADQGKVTISRNGSRTFVNVKKVRQNIEKDPSVEPGDKISVPRSFW